MWLRHDCDDCYARGGADGLGSELRDELCSVLGRKGSNELDEFDGFRETVFDTSGSFEVVQIDILASFDALNQFVNNLCDCFYSCLHGKMGRSKCVEYDLYVCFMIERALYISHGTSAGFTKGRIAGLDCCLRLIL